MALLVEADGRIHVGSGVLVYLDGDAGRTDAGRVVVATAAHNLDGAAGPRAVRVVPRGRYRADPLRVLAIGLPPGGGLDLAWIEVDAREVRQRSLAPIRLSQLVAAAVRSEGVAGSLTVHGFPASHVPWPSLGGTRFELAPATLSASVVVCSSRPLDFAVTWADAPSGTGFHPRGLSGCGVWTLRGGVATPVALARSWHGGRRLLYCTPISGWVAWLTADQKGSLDVQN